jgi:FADH2 O2-dependent halogenase
MLERPCARFGTRRDACTVHHCFDGGWFWIIRFDSGICSVGLVLDRNTHADSNLANDVEFWSFVNRFPTVAEQLGEATAIRPLVKTARLQFTSRRIFGDRYLLAPHAASFVDPLFSTGMDLTAAFISRMSPLVVSLARDDRLRAERFAALDACHQTEIDGIDRIVHGMLCSFRHPDVFKQYWRCWITASLVQYFCQLSSDPADPTPLLAHYGASLPLWNRQLDSMYRAVSTDKFANPGELARQLKKSMDEFPEPYDKQQSNWEVGSPEACCPVIRPKESTAWFDTLLSLEPALAAPTRHKLLAQSQARFETAYEEFLERYQRSAAQGTPFHQGVDFIRAHQF